VDYIEDDEAIVEMKVKNKESYVYQGDNK